MTASADPYAAFSSPVDASAPAPAAPTAAASAPQAGYSDAAAASRNALYQHIADTQGAEGVIAALKAEGVDPASIDENAIRLGIAFKAPVSTIGVPNKPVADHPGAQPAPAPPPAAANDLYAALSSPVDASAPPPPDPGAASDGQAQTLGEGLSGGVRNVLEGGGNLLNTVTAPIRAPMAAVGLPVDYAADASALADKLGLSHIDGVAGAIQKGLSEGLLTAGAGTALGAADGLAGAAGKFIGDNPIAQTVSSGTAAGSGEAAKEDGYGTLGQTVASIAGGLGGAGVAMGAPAAVAQATAERTPSDLLAAFQRQQVQPMADQVGGTASRAASGITRMTLGGIPLAQAAEKSIATAKAARDRIAATIGRVTDDTGAGQAAQKGARAFLDTSQAQASKLYDAIPIDGGGNASLTNTRNALYDLTQGMKSNPELSKMVAENPRLKGYLDALTPKDELVERHLVGGGKGQPFIAKKGGELSWDDLKRFRSIIGEIAGQPSLAADTSQQSMRKLYGALSEDMRATAAQTGPKTLSAFERANTFWRARQARIDNVLTNILGDDYKKSPEDAFKQIQSWSREGGDAARVAQAMRSLPEAEANTVRASLFSRMGNVTAGRQNVEGNVFSPSDFASHWAKMDHRAKSILFPGSDYRQSLDDIARIADSMKRSGEFANTSKTAFAGNGIALLSLALAGHPLEAGGLAAGQLTAGKLLASPRFANWLASSARKPNGPALLAHINRLTAIATAEPAIANEVLALQQRLASAFTHSQASLAAQEPNNEQQRIER